ncbi:hypothetical protein HQ520_08455, partial [bacterium]|nr:hypothetical protein [bacterium]
MNRIEILADMAGRHSAHDVYDLWVEQRESSILLGWDCHDGRQCTFSIMPDGKVQPVGRPWSAVPQGESYCAVGEGERPLRVWHELREQDGGERFGIACTLPNGEKFEFDGDGVSLLFPAVCVAADGTPWVAWIRCGDVENEDGVVDQFNEIECAHLRDGKWVREVVADLRYGLLPIAGVWGYPGRRRRPYIVPDDRGGVWVMWERKEPHNGPTTKVPGCFCGRRYADGCWQEPVRLIEDGYMDYFPAMHGVEDGTIVVAAQKGCPEDGRLGRGVVVALDVAVEGAPVLERDTGFEQWLPIHLTEREFFLPPERELEQDGETYHLLFGDPHTHTCLSCDAEGDLIESLAYARDRAKIDFVTITDNDFVYGGRLSDAGWRDTMVQGQAWSEEGRFIAIPGYEWTQTNWGPTRPQHRSVLFSSYDQPILRWRDAEGDPIEALV